MQHLLHLSETEDQTTSEAREKSQTPSIKDAREQKCLHSPKEGRQNCTCTSSVIYS